MINPAVIAAVEDLAHFANPARFKQSVQHATSGLLSKRTWRGFRKGGGGIKQVAKDLGHTLKGGIWDIPFAGTGIITLPLAAYMAGSAPEGKKASTGAGYAAAYGLAAIPGAILGGTFGGLASSILFGGALDHGIQRGMQYLKETGRRTSRMNMGGRYRDSQAAYTMRQRAVQDLAGGLMNARQHLGQEAAYFTVSYGDTMARTLDQVDSALASLEARVTDLDGIDAEDPDTAVVSDLRKEIRGLRTTIRQASLTLQSQIGSLEKQVTALRQQLEQHLVSSR